MTPQDPRTTPGPGRRRRRTTNLLIPVLFVGAALFVLRDEIPWLGEWVQRLTDPAAAKAAEVCRDAALRAAARPDFTRVVRAGEVHATEGGFFVEGIELGEMGEGGAEQRYRFNCYIDRVGNLVEAGRVSSARP